MLQRHHLERALVVPHGFLVSERCDRAVAGSKRISA
jgi:hypothetical protein